MNSCNRKALEVRAAMTKVTPELEAMADAIDQERWNVAFQMVKGKTISDREASERLARSALMAIREPSDPAMIAAYLGEPPANPDAIRWTRRSFSAVIDHILGEPHQLAPKVKR